MKKILLGVGLEIAAFALLLLAELWRLPVTFPLFVHLCAVYYFTRGFDRILEAIELRRELCFFFSLVFPLAGMAGIVFYILVLKRLGVRPLLTGAAAVPLDERALPPASDSIFLEDDYFTSLSSAFVRRLSPAAGRGPDLDSALCCREDEYWRREQELSARIRELENNLAGGPGDDTRRLLAGALLQYVELFQADPRLRDHYLTRAEALYRELEPAVLEEREVLDRLAAIAFLDGRLRECLRYCEKLKRIDPLDRAALMRTGECFLRLRDFRKLTLLARSLAANPAAPPDMKELAQMWCQYG